MSEIARLIIEQGRAAAEARAQQGALWGRAVENISQVPGQVMQQQRQNQRLDFEKQAMQSRLVSEGQQQQLGQMQIAKGQQQIRAEQLVGSVPQDEQGNLDVKKLADLARAQDPALVPHVTALAQTANTATNAYAEQQLKADEMRDNARGEIGLKLLQRPDDLGSFHTAVTQMLKRGLLDSQTANQMLASSVAQPGFIQQQAQTWVRGSKEARAAVEPKIIMAKEGDTPLIEDRSGPTPTFNPLPGFTPQPKPPTEAVLDAEQQRILSKENLGQQLTPAEAASKHAYQSRKQTVSDPAAAAAAERQAQSLQSATDRQSRTIDAQTSQQKRAQDFAQLQAARADIEKNVNTPYLTAKGSANTLRDVVTAAQNGNKVAGSLQSLETTMAAIRAQGLNRINKTETDMAGNAGSMYDRVSGWLGKAVAGQPVPADIQKDMLSFADILENAAYKKYRAGHEASTKLYGVTTLQPSIAPPASVSTSGGSQEGQVQAIPGFPGMEQTYRNGKWVRTK